MMLKVFRYYLPTSEVAVHIFFYKKVFLNYFTEFTGNDLCRSLFFDKYAGFSLQLSIHIIYNSTPNNVDKKKSICENCWRYLQNKN